MKTGDRVRVRLGSWKGERGTVAGRPASTAQRGEHATRAYVVPVQLDCYADGCLTGFPEEVLEPLAPGDHPPHL